MDDFVVVGGGIVGLAVARALLLRTPGIRVTVLEKGDEIGTAQTGHNSGVIHAGIYYAPGSLKARLCRTGATATREFCDLHSIPYRTIGKLVVATSPVEVDRLRRLAERARMNGIELRDVDRAELRDLEPNITGMAALLSSATGVVDFRMVARAMAAEVTELGGVVVTRSEVRQISEDASGVSVGSDTGDYRARHLVACAGLQADRVAALGGMAVDFRIVPFRGEYYQLPAHRSDVVRSLIYPVPDPALPFLGIHLSPTIDGRVTVGPNAVLGLAREGYAKWMVDPSDALAIATDAGFWRFARQNLRTGLREMRNSLSKRSYLAEVRKFCPSLTLGDLRPYPAGIRAQAITLSGKSVDDFLVRSTPRQLHVCNAPSPAATSAMAIGAHIVAQLAERGAA